MVESIRRLIESDADGGKIGIVLGPTGSGKTLATMEACSTSFGRPNYSNYILYKEIYMNSQVAEQLAHVAGIPLTRNIFDSIFNSFGLDCQAYYFPEDSDKAITYVLNKVAKRSKEALAKKSLKHLPCFVIDAAELLAMHKPDLLDTVVRLGKYYARAKKLR